MAKKKKSAEEKHLNTLISDVVRLTAKMQYLREHLNIVEERVRLKRNEISDARKALLSEKKYQLNSYERAMATTNKIQAIKAVRDRYATRNEHGIVGFPLGLKDAKDLVDEYTKGF